MGLNRVAFMRECYIENSSDFEFIKKKQDWIYSMPRVGI